MNSYFKTLFTFFRLLANERYDHRNAAFMTGVSNDGFAFETTNNGYGATRVRWQEV
jgi:hypothetical protein